MGAINFVRLAAQYLPFISMSQISSFFRSFVVCAGLSRSLVLASVRRRAGTCPIIQALQMSAPSQLNNILSVIVIVVCAAAAARRCLSTRRSR